MRTKLLMCLAVVAIAASPTLADRQWTGGGATERWDDNGNWDFGTPPTSATVLHDPPPPPNNFNNSAVNLLDGANILIEDGIDAVAFGLQVGGPKPGTLGGNAATNTLNMTGGSLTVQGNFLINVGRSRNADPAQLAQMNVSGGVVNASGITVPEAFDPNNVLGFTSVGINAELHVSGDAVVNTDLLRLGAQDANSTVTISDNARVNLTDDNNGFAPGVLWIEAFENPVVGTSLLDIQDNGVLTVWGEWWTDENGNGNRDGATESELQYFIDNYINTGWIVANGGADPVQTSFRDADGNGQGVIVLSAVANPTIPEPSTLVLAAIACSLIGRRRK